MLRHLSSVEKDILRSNVESIAVLQPVLAGHVGRHQSGPEQRLLVGIGPRPLRSGHVRERFERQRRQSKRDVAAISVDRRPEVPGESARVEGNIGPVVLDHCSAVNTAKGQRIGLRFCAVESR